MYLRFPCSREHPEIYTKPKEAFKSVQSHENNMHHRSRLEFA